MPLTHIYAFVLLWVQKFIGYLLNNIYLRTKVTLDYIYIYIGHDNSFFKERSGREGMTVASVLLGTAVEVGVGSNPTIAK